MAKLIDPIDSMSDADKKDPAKVKTERLKAWKRESTAKARKDAKADRIARWEQKTGRTWGGDLWTP